MNAHVNQAQSPSHTSPLETKRRTERDYSYLKYQLNTSRYQYVGIHLQSDEEIKSVTHGEVAGGGKAHMIATRSHVFFILSSPSIHGFEEISYDIIYGATIATKDGLSTLYLLSKPKTYKLTNVNINQANQLIDVVESRLYARDMLRSIRQESEQPMKQTISD